MTKEDQAFLDRITAYINKKSINSDPNQRATATTSQQIDKLKPIFMKIANEDGCEISDVLVRYMDLSSQAAAEKAAREQRNFMKRASTADSLCCWPLRTSPA